MTRRSHSQGIDGYCKAALDCASYVFYGESACSEACGIESQCLVEKFPGLYNNFKGSGTCCKAVPEGKVCSKSRQGEHSGCSTSMECTTSADSGQPICTKKTYDQWVIGVLISLLGSLTLNLGVNIQKYAFRKNLMKPPRERKKSSFRLPVSYVIPCNCLNTPCASSGVSACLYSLQETFLRFFPLATQLSR